MTAKVLQKPKIVEIIGGSVRIAHPDISGNIRTYLNGPLTAAGTSAVVADNNGIANVDNILIGVPGFNQSEVVAINGAVTLGQNLTIANTTKFNHSISNPVTKVYETQIKLYGASSDGGSLTLITTVSIQWDKAYTEYTLITTDTAYAYYVAKFYDGTTESSASDYVANTGLSTSSCEYFIKQAFEDITNTKLDGQKFTRETAVRWCNECQDVIKNFTYQDPVSGRFLRKEWSFENAESTADITVTTNEFKFALTGLNLKFAKQSKAIIDVRVGSSAPLTLIDHVRDMDTTHKDNVKTAVKTLAVVGGTTLVVDSNIELADAGTVYVGVDTITYTGKSGTDTLTGISVSDITVAHPVGTNVWQGTTPSLPSKYCIDGNYIVFDKPFSSDYAGFSIKLRYWLKLTPLTEASDSTVVPFTLVFPCYLAYKIELKKQNMDKAAVHLGIFKDLMKNEALADESPEGDVSSYYNFSDSFDFLPNDNDD